MDLPNELNDPLYTITKAPRRQPLRKTSEPVKVNYISTEEFYKQCDALSAIEKFPPMSQGNVAIQKIVGE
jgi:hypothetical protein